jgi:hypothetical protein
MRHKWKWKNDGEAVCKKCGARLLRILELGARRMSRKQINYVGDRVQK